MHQRFNFFSVGGISTSTVKETQKKARSHDWTKVTKIHALYVNVIVIMNFHYYVLTLKKIKAYLQWSTKVDETLLENDAFP